MMEDVQLQLQLEQDLAPPLWQLPPSKILRKIKGGSMPVFTNWLDEPPIDRHHNLPKDFFTLQLVQAGLLGMEIESQEEPGN